MITVEDYKDIAAKCHAVDVPNETAYLILAAATYMTDREQRTENISKAEMRQMIEDALSTQQHSFSAAPENPDTVSYTSDTEFGKAVTGKNIDDIIRLFDELMTAVFVHKKQLYNLVMERLAEL